MNRCHRAAQSLSTHLRPERAYGPIPLVAGPRSWFSQDMSETSIHIHQCPFCDLRFPSVNEVRDHVIHDHPTHAKSFETTTPHETA